MDMKDLIAEINALAKKKREVGLSAEEQKRQKELYAIYLKGFREQVRERLDNVDVTYPDGTVKSLKDAMKKKP
ncbi:MAG: DUF896 domain-containing protein [Ruminococcus sp.]|nr:DUF896 domain-containing protein [Ruminococcus sp.]